MYSDSGSEENGLEDVEAWYYNGDPDLDPDNRLGTTNWCVCQHCEPMPQPKESVCRQELNQVPCSVTQCAASYSRKSVVGLGPVCTCVLCKANVPEHVNNFHSVLLALLFVTVPENGLLSFSGSESWIKPFTEFYLNNDNYNNNNDNNKKFLWPDISGLVVPKGAHLP